MPLKRFFFIIVAVGVFWGPGVKSSEAPVWTLKTLYQRAKEKNEALQIQQSLLGQSEEQVVQARGAILPRIDLAVDYTRQDSLGDEGSSVAGAFRRSDQTIARITFLQPLFKGLREFAAYRAMKAQRNSVISNFNYEKAVLYSSVATAFYTVLSVEADIENVRSLIELTKKRVKDLRARERIGRSRKSEVLSAESQLALSQAELRGLEAERLSAREDLAFAVGVSPSAKLDDRNGTLAKLKPLEFFLERLEIREDIQSKKFLFDVADESVGVAKGERLPTLDFSGNYYLKRTGILEGSKWDIRLTLGLPLFQGGIISSKIRESAEKKKQAELELRQARREALREIRSLYSKAEITFSQLDALRTASDVAKKNYESLRREYRFAQATNLEVIQAMNSFIEAKRRLDQTTYDFKTAFESLNAAIGVIP